MAILPMSCDISFDHLVKMVSTRSLHCKVTLFLFIINK